MTGSELVQLVIGLPIAFVVACYFGRKAQRYLWKLDRPYSERLAAIGRG